MMQNPKKKVLVVEDNPMNMILIKEILAANGFEVIEAYNGHDAIKRVSEEMPDLILMDLNLPKMDGVTATKILKSNTPSKAIPIVAITASAMKGDEEKILAEGFDGYIAKPIEMKKFMKDVALFIKK